MSRTNQRPIHCLSGALLLAVGSSALAHGLIQDPPSRNWYCGAVTKPDQAGRPDAQYPQCADAFAGDQNGGYQFMSVLTHARGRAVVRPLPQNVCGFDSETWNGGSTPWDKSINWPTNNMSSGRQKFSWNISWGPHFDDTEEFRYWITKPGFQYQEGKPLTWNDFEETAFCALKYDDKNPDANADIIADKANAMFHTTCTVPQRQGRHVIYGEWGRNQYTLERFHSCVDVKFDGDSGGGDIPVLSKIALQPNLNEFIGDGSIVLDGTGSQGSNLKYQWSVNAPNAALYRIDNATQAKATLHLANPQAAGNVTVSLLVSNANGSNNASATFAHVPASTSDWVDLGQVTNQARTLKIGDTVSIRVVMEDGQDVYLPATPLRITEPTTSADAWPYALAQAVNQLSHDLRVGVLTSSDEVNPARSATANRLFTTDGSGMTAAYLQVVENNGGNTGGGTLACKMGSIDTWNGGFVLHNITVTNNTQSTINRWSTRLNFSRPVQIVNAWNGKASGSETTIVVSNESYNAELAPGQSTTFGMQGRASGIMTMPTCTTE